VASRSWPRRLRKLAEESQSAASTIAELIREIQHEPENAVSVVETGSRQTEDGVAAVAEQSSASSQQVSASTEETSASTERVAASAGELARTAEELEQLVRRFTLA